MLQMHHLLQAGFVVKVKQPDQSKVFVNIVHSDQVAKAETKSVDGKSQWSIPHNLGPPRSENDKSRCWRSVWRVVLTTTRWGAVHHIRFLCSFRCTTVVQEPCVQQNAGGGTQSRAMCSVRSLPRYHAPRVTPVVWAFLAMQVALESVDSAANTHLGKSLRLSEGMYVPSSVLSSLRPVCGSIQRPSSRFRDHGMVQKNRVQQLICGNIVNLLFIISGKPTVLQNVAYMRGDVATMTLRQPKPSAGTAAADAAAPTPKSASAGLAAMMKETAKETTQPPPPPIAKNAPAKTKTAIKVNSAARRTGSTAEPSAATAAVPAADAKAAPKAADITPTASSKASTAPKHPIAYVCDGGGWRVTRWLTATH